MSNTACEIQRDRIQEALDGALATTERPLLEAHLTECAGCRAYEGAIARTASRLSMALGTPVEVPDLALAIERARPWGGALPARRVRRSRYLAWALVAACTLLAVGLAAPRGLSGNVPPLAVGSPAPMDAASLKGTAADIENGRDILAWFGPEADADTEE